jgi:hypothetical protein
MCVKLCEPGSSIATVPVTGAMFVSTPTIGLGSEFVIGVTGAIGAVRLNVAVTAAGEVTVPAQAAVPPQAPDQPAKTEPGAGVSVSETIVPDGKSVVHVAPQLIPAGVLVTVPEPVPASETVTGTCGGMTAKVAVTNCGPSIVRTQVALPEQAPVQPVKVDPAAGVAVSVTVESR